MIFKNLKEYKFKSYIITAYLSDFWSYNSTSDNVKMHEQTLTNNEISMDTDINEFEPIILGLYPDVLLNNTIKTLTIDRVCLLDGHHRWKYAVKKNQVSKLKCILVNYLDIKIFPYKFILNIEKEEFFNKLNDLEYFETNNSELFIQVDQRIFTSSKLNSIFDLYELKKTFQDESLISPLTESKKEDYNTVTFTPIEKNTIYNEDTLFPPKSTWITPRL